MTRSSEQSIYGGATPSKPSHAIHEKVKSSKKSIAKGKVDSFMSTINGGGDPVTAVALRPGSSSGSAAERRARIEREMAKVSR
ncbi:hypothetical protein PG991_011906 [Apiospora marii]|uniref:Uncharacterized protein n=1 Tax=Apiospora marii TaxID=335849 RepID=A0ABR1RFX7_9PEZI